MTTRLLFSLLLITFALELSGYAQPRNPQPVVTAFRLEKLVDAPIGNRLYITVNGRERKISNQALDAWIIDDGKSIAYSWLDGSGGFENEGESLRIYDVRSGKARKVLSEYVAIVALMPVRLTTGQLALLVKMGDGGLGASYFAVVDPKRGEIFYRRWAELVEVKGDRIRLAFFNEDDWDAINQASSEKPDDPNQVISTTAVKPKRFENHDLKRVLKMKVIYNKRDRL